jgi:hypothetical protein
MGDERLGVMAGYVLIDHADEFRHDTIAAEGLHQPAVDVNRSDRLLECAGK